MPKSNDFDDTDIPATERLRLVQLLDLDPGVQGKGATAKKVVILRLGHGGEVEQPLSLSLWDARRLTRLLIQARDHHGDPLGESLHDRVEHVAHHEHQPSWWEDGDPSEFLPADPAVKAISGKRRCYFEVEISKPRKLTPNPSTSVKVSIGPSIGPAYRYAHLHGGYTDGENDVLLYRTRTKAGIHDGLLWVDAKGRWRPESDITEDSLLPTYYWPSFFLNADGNKLLLGDGTRWRKMAEAEFAPYHGRTLEPLFRANGPPDSRRKGG